MEYWFSSPVLLYSGCYELIERNETRAAFSAC